MRNSAGHNNVFVREPSELWGTLLCSCRTGYFATEQGCGQPVVRLAGLMGSIEEWKSFRPSGEQRSIKNKLRYFKMSEAMSLEGLFKRGWTNSAARSDEYVELAEIIEELQYFPR